jgi:hypothetical protein
MDETFMTSRRKALEQSGEHSFYFKELRLGISMLDNLDHAQVAREQKKILEFAGGAHRHVQELAKFSPPPAAAALCDVCGDRTGCTPDLAAESKPLVRRKLARNLVRTENELVASTPNLELAEVLHFADLSHIVVGTMNYLQLNTNNCQLQLRSSHAD